MLEIKQNVSINQSLVMTAQLQQSIKILQLSSIDLDSFIDEQLQTNPFLEVVEDKSENDTSPVPNYSNYSPIVVKKTDKEFDFNNYVKPDTTISLRSFVLNQIFAEFEDKEKNIAAELTDLLDDNGYIKDEDIGNLILEKKYDSKQIQKLISKLQNLEPNGIFARNLTESLTIQLKNKNLYNEQFSKLLDNIDLLAKGEKLKLLKKCKLSEDDFKNLLIVIKSLNPKPGSIFSCEETKYIKPDLYGIIDNSGNIIVELNSQFSTKIALKSNYYQEIKAKISDNDGKNYLKNEYYSANSLVKSIENREKTILKVAKAIFCKQESFFTKGIMSIKPLTLSEIASELDIHESTVSRVTNGKYIMTPHGLFELKYFFSNKISNLRDSLTSSSIAVKHLIQKMIDSEEDEILSDDSISIMLTKFNISIARRTVAKYREELNIPTSATRKRKKLLAI